jgi:hypothetical protein
MGMGCPFEPGVVRLWQSDDFDERSTTGPRAARFREAVAVAQHARLALEVGLSPDAPAEAVWDLRAELGLDPAGPAAGRGDDRPIFVYYPEPADAGRRPA